MNSAGENPQSFRPDLRAKRKRSGPPTMDTAGPSFESYNSFSVLSDTDSETETAESGKPPSPKKERIPPVVVYSYLPNHTNTLRKLNEKLQAPVEVKTKQNRLLLYTKTENDYEMILGEIQKAKLEYHTYPLPNKHQPKITLKGIPPNVPVDEIKEELTLRNVQVINIRQLTKRDKTTTQIIQHYPIFIVTLKEGTDVREVTKINKLCHCVVQWERYRALRPIQQCFKCQKYGHSSSYCGRQANCVKCGQPHATSDCEKLQTESPVCVNCGGPHPANFTGCPIYVNILEARTRKVKPQTPRTPGSVSGPPRIPPPGKPRTELPKTRTWAQIAAQNASLPNETSIPELIRSFQTIWSSINLQTLGMALRTLAIRIQETQDPMTQILSIIETLLQCFVPAP